MTPAAQLCPDCGSPLRPCKCEDDDRRSVPGSTLKTRTRLKAKPFSKRYDGKGERYGSLFRAVREMKCWLAVEGYYGIGHEGCGPGTQDSGADPMGFTAHHVGRTDEDGLLPVCGSAHDLVAGYGGRTTQKIFRAWLDSKGLSIEAAARRYVDVVRESLE